MGFFGDLDLENDVEEIGFSDPDIGNYNFTVVGAELKKGNKNDPEALAIMIRYTLDNSKVTGKAHSEYFIIPQPADPKNQSDVEQRQGGYLKARLISLGVEPSRLNDFEPDDIIDVTGTLAIGRNKNDYVTTRNVKVDEKRAATAAAAPVRQVASRPKAAPKATPKPAPEQVQDYAVEDVPDEAPAAPVKPKPASVLVENPFA